MDTRFDNRVLDLRKPERRAIFHVRSVVAAALRSYLDRQGFVEVHTPKLAGAGAEDRRLSAQVLRAKISVMITRAAIPMATPTSRQ